MAESALSSLPDVFSCSMPDPAMELPDHERMARVAWDDNFLLLDGTRCFVRARLPVAGQEPELVFSYVCWVEVTREVYEISKKLWREPTTRALIRFEGTLANALPPFEEDLGARVNVSVVDWRAPNPVITDIASAATARLMKPPGVDRPTFMALLGEVLREDFARLVQQKLAVVWGEPGAFEEFEATDWRRAPRHQVIGEFQPPPGEPWRYCTLGMSSRPMPGGNRAEFAWEVPRQITDPRVLQAMARIAAQPWHMKVPFFDGYVLPVPGGFPPGSEFRYALCYDASQAFSTLASLRVFDQPVHVLMPLPIMEKERANLRPDETRFLNLKDFIR